jgi:hypothetical protein
MTSTLARHVASSWRVLFPECTMPELCLRVRTCRVLLLTVVLCCLLSAVRVDRLSWRLQQRVEPPSASPFLTRPSSCRCLWARSGCMSTRWVLLQHQLVVVHGRRGQRGSAAQVAAVVAARYCCLVQT